MSQTLGLRQEQRLTPQLIQSMNILQLPVLALESKIREELERNPALEEEEPARPESAPADDLPPGADGGPAQGAEEFSRLERLSREYDFDEGDQPYARPRSDGGERDAKLDAMANTASRPESLNEYLLHQWAFVGVNGDIRKAGELIIGHVEEDGYLRTSLEEIAAKHDPPFTAEQMEEALSWVQSLEPAGIAARDLKECLLNQISALEGDHELERILIEQHLVDIEKNRYPAIAKATGRSLEEIKRAVGNLRRLLTPHPGRLVVDRDVPMITPDVIVEWSEEENDYVVRLARGNSPRLRVSDKYRRMMADQHHDRETREFIRKNIENAGALIDAIEYRRNRLLEVSREVLQRQRDFFEIGPAGMKVLRMSELAEKFDCDPSTISRTVADKYMQTPRGIFPLRMFFTGGTETTDTGQATSWDSVKARVQEIIRSEDKSDPLSDDAIAERLQKEGLDVSRRTIAKYRQQLNIPAARQRKEF
ncbi:MAG: RNA polymerase factor sigma-54 [Phycisphaerae bacterium]